MMVFTRDLRTSDNPALVEAWKGIGKPTMLFVLDEKLLERPNLSSKRLRFLSEALHDLDRSLGLLGASLVVRKGDWSSEVLVEAVAVGASDIHVSDDFSAYATSRFQRLEAEGVGRGIRVHRHPGVSVVPPDLLQPAGGGGYKVFTPYFRRWSSTQWRSVELPLHPRGGSAQGPKEIKVIENIQFLEALAESSSNDSITGGETAGQERLSDWLDTGIENYGLVRDRPEEDATSRFSAYLHFGCLSPLEVAVAVSEQPDSEEFLRQLAWRDFFLQVLAHRPDASFNNFRERGNLWNQDSESLHAWATGMTGFPLVDAGMRQLEHEGFMHNRCRMVTASFLVKDLNQDWRLGANHFMRHLIDGDVASNQLGWQWVAGTGTDTNPHRILNPIRQSERFDPKGAYIRRWIPELAEVDSPEIHDPSPEVRQKSGYPDQIVDHHEAIAHHRAMRAT
ncbi:MAG: deoxyribodipyrimidine photo-lyase [Acidimicrobiales bacterium]|nr:deoxyribodipyrimidine photo-lyase [Acidimicrobiales bacterium]